MKEQDIFASQMASCLDKAMILPYVQGNVLDLGAGEGTISRLILNEGHNVTSVELDKYFCKKYLFERSYYQKGVLCSLKTHNINLVQYVTKFEEFNESKFDTIILSAVLHELTDNERIKVLSHLHNLLLPNGRIIIRDAFIDNSKMKINSNFYLTFPNEKNYKYVQNYINRHNLLVKTSDSNSTYISTNIYDLYNIMFAFVFGLESFENREQFEKRYSYSIDLLKSYFGEPLLYSLYSKGDIKKYLEIFQLKDEEQNNLINSIFTNGLAIFQL